MFEPNDDIQRVVAQQAGEVQATVCLSSKVLLISEDRLELALKDGIGKVNAGSAWCLPAGILLSSVATLVTASFHTLFGVVAAVWQAIFIIVAILSGIWLVVSLMQHESFESKDFLRLIVSAGSAYNQSAIDPSIAPNTSKQEILSQTPSPINPRTKNKTSRAIGGASRDGNQINWENSIGVPTRIKTISRLPQCRRCGSFIGSRSGATAVCPLCKTVN